MKTQKSFCIMTFMADKQHAPYLVYVLRLWRNGQDVPWCAALECPRTGERHPFADLAALFAFIESETGDLVPHDEDTGGREKSQTVTH